MHLSMQLKVDINIVRAYKEKQATDSEHNLNEGTETSLECEDVDNEWS